jgi:hypothetical protein
MTSAMPRQWMAGVMVAIAMCLLSSHAGAWGLLDAIDRTDAFDPETTAYFPFNILRYGQLNVCVDNQKPDQFSTESLEAQVKAALKIWLREVPVANSLVQIKKCRKFSLDQVRIVVGDQPEHAELTGYGQPHSVSPQRWVYWIYINTAFKDLGHRTSSTGFTQDIAKWLKQDEPLEPQLLALDTVTLKDFAAQHGIAEYDAWLSSYSLLLHELGHAFGLCDLYEPEIDRCDKRYMSRAQPERGIMQGDPLTFGLAQDDVDGIRAAFDIFKGWAE